MDLVNASLEMVQGTGGHHLTEDAGWGGMFEDSATMVVADGAAIRLRPMKSLQPMLDRYAPRYGEGITPSGIAARLIRDTVAELAVAYPAVPIAEMVVRANQRLADELCAIYGELTAAAIAEQEPHLTILHEDPRMIRLALPASTYAVARANWVANTLEVVQGADAAVFIMYRDGTTRQVTPDQMGQHDDKFKALWLTQPDEPAEHPFFLALGDNLAREVNRFNGLYHNFVGEQGELDPAVGVSVVDGLPEMVDYMFKATFTLNDVRAVLVTSDGMFWPSPLDESPADELARINHMGKLILQDGLASYVKALRVEEARLRDTGINPYQWHDDATALLLRL